ncbi:HdeD family acid-resistance protein [Actinoplanes sp. NPDC020271]|uniref:HdeD family acid-resistance protein n=1 Tax=Actinoplanes sp. NPDC020271 TaxID=3363896 RepID=UPI0037B79985
MTRTTGWASLIAGVAALVLGIVAFAWPSATLHVVGVLFGLNLLILGVVRACQFLFTDEESSAGARILGVIFGVLVGLLGILCLRNVAGSITLLLVIVALGWLLDGLAEIFTSVGSPRSGLRIGLGLVVVLASIAILVWPGLGLATFVLFGATTLCFVGIGGIIVGIAGLRSRDAQPV